MFKRFLAWLFGPAPELSRQLHVNESAAPGTRTRVNLTAVVNAASIKIEVLDGRNHLVIPSYTLPDDVIMNGGLYPHDEIEKSYNSLEGSFAPLGHPVVNGEYVSAKHPMAINAHHVGAWNRSVQRKGNRIAVEKVVDIDYAANNEGGRRLLARIGYDVETGKLTGNVSAPIHTSTGIFLHRQPVANAKGYTWIARNMEFDHDAILLDGPGAATPDDGVGMMVNSMIEHAVPLEVNDALAKDSYGWKNRLLNEAARAKWGSEDSFAYVEDFDNKTAIVSRREGSLAVGYTIDGDKVTWADSSEPVVAKTSWIGQVNRFLQSLANGVNSGPDIQQTPEGTPDMDRKELDAALAANQTATLDAVKGLLAPLTEGLGALQANHKALADTLTANARAAEADKRKAVAEKIGQAAADLLTGNALDETHAALVGAAPLVPGFQGNRDSSGFKQTELPE